MDRAQEERTLEKTHDLLARSRHLLRQLDRRIEHGDQDLDDAEDDLDGVRLGHSADNEEAYTPPRRPK
jgi:hypothetical protein